MQSSPPCCTMSPPTCFGKASMRLKRGAAPGVDGVTWPQYESGPRRSIWSDLHRRVHAGTYRAQPSRRAYIPKADGRMRPLGIAALEDKIVQQAVVQVLNAIYEEDFLGFSYGFRPGRSQHDALDALWVGLMGKKVNWVLDADIRGFFDTIDHGWLMKFVEHRIADRRMLRLIQKWLKAGCPRTDEWSETKVGTPQGAVASPLLANALSSLCLRPVGPSVAKTSRQRRHDRRPLRGRLSSWDSSTSTMPSNSCGS